MDDKKKMAPDGKDEASSTAADQQSVNVQVPVSGGARNLTITLAISIQVTEIPGVTIGLAGVDLKHTGPVAADVAAIQASMQQQQQAANRNADDGNKETKKPTFFSWKKKSQKPAPQQPPQQQQEQQQQQQITESAEPSVAESSVSATSSTAPVAPPRPLPPAPGCASDPSAQRPPLPPPPPMPATAAINSVAGAAAAAIAVSAPSAGKIQKKSNDKDSSSSDDDEIDMTKPMPDLGRNTVESDAGDAGESTCGSTGAKEKTSVSKKLSIFGTRKKKEKKTSQGAFNFPQDLPDSAKALFEIMSDMRLITTVYASNAGRTAAVKKQKNLMMEGVDKRFTVDGKPRSVWLDPSPGEQVEIWKEYFSSDGECNRALGRLPGTDKYGYILRDEIDEEKQFDTKEQTEAYNDSLQLLTMFMDIYGNE